MKPMFVVTAIATVAAIALPAQAQMTSPVVPSAAPQVIAQSADSTAIAQELINLLATGDYIAALNLYDGSVQTSLTPDSLRQNWQDITTDLGAFQGIVSTSMIPLTDSEASVVVVVTSQFEMANRDFYVTLTGDRVASVNIAEAQ